MSREILFRGKSIGIDVWLYGILFNYELTAPSNVPCISVCVPTSWKEAYNFYAVQPNTIGQYTGLTDKKGVKIFEGDVVIIGEKLKAKVIYYDGAFRMQSEFSPTPIDTTDMGYMMREFSVRVIGNIHDNPELIK